MLKNIFKARDASEKVKYDLEKEYNKRIRASYQALDSLNIAEEKLTDEAEQRFEQKEREYAKSKQALESSHQKSREKLIQEQTKERDEKASTLTRSKASVKEQIEALRLDYKKSSLFIEDELAELDQDRQVKIKEIEKKHLENANIYQEKLSLYQDNLKKNQQKNKKRIEMILETLQGVYSDYEKNAAPIHQALDNDLKTLEKSLKDDLKNENDALKAEAKTIATHMTNFRKRMNQNLKEIQTNINETRSALEAPYAEFVKHFSAFRHDLQDRTTKTEALINHDFEFEQKRIDSRLKTNGNNQPDAKEIKDLQHRLKLAELRKNALLSQAKAIQHLLKDETQSIETIINDHKTLLSEAFERQETNIRDHHNQLKDIFSLVENHVTQIEKDTKKATQSFHVATTFQAIKSFVEASFDAFNTFELERLNTHITTTEKLAPIFEEVDEISMTLEIIEPLKEIEISKQRQTIDEQDATRRYDMREAKLQYDLDVLTLRHETRTKEREIQSTLAVHKEQENYDNLIIAQKYDLEAFDIEITQTLSEETFELRKHHLENDIDLAKARQKLERERLDIEKDIKVNSMEKEFLLESMDIERERDEQTRKQTYDLKENQQALEIAIEKERKIQASTDNTLEVTHRKLKSEYEANVKDLEAKIDSEEENLQDRLHFIDKALEKETEHPRQNIKSIENLAAHRIASITQHSEPLITTLDDYQRALENPDIHLRELLVLVSQPFENLIDNWANHLYDTYIDALRFVHDVQLKHLEQDDGLARKLQLQKQRLIADADRVLAKVEKQKHQTIDAYHRRLNATKESIKNIDKTTIKSLKAHIKPLYQLLKETTESEHESIISAIKENYAQLYEQDETLIKRAKENHEKAQTKAKEQHQQTIKPIQDQIEKEKQILQKNIAQSKTSEQGSRKKDIDSLASTTDALRKKIKDLETEKTRIESRYEDRLATLEEEHKTAIKQLDQERENQEENLKFQTKKTIQKFTTRLEDAKKIVDYEQTMYEKDIEHLENKKQEAFLSHQQKYEHDTAKHQAELQTLRETLDEQLEKLKNDLDKKNRAFEDMSLTSAARLETMIDEATRNIDQDALLKRERLKSLLQTNSALVNDLYRHIAHEHETLTTTIQKHRQDLLDTFEQTSVKTHEYILESQDTFVDNIMQKIVNDILNRD